MTAFDQYVFVLCLIVFVTLTGLFATMIYGLVTVTVKLIRKGGYDEDILRESKKKVKKRSIFGYLDKVVSIVLCLAFLGCFAFSAFLNVTENDFSSKLSSLKVVKSASMAEKYQGNSYLYQHDLNDQLAMFDLIVCNPLPAEQDLKPYDIVLYEGETGLIIHRIISIEEPNDRHPNGRYFRLQGDANKYSDTYPVTYDQMRGIYRGERIPFLGNVVMFFQAPAGWICILLILVAAFVAPLVEKYLNNERKARLILLQKGANGNDPNALIGLAQVRLTRFRAGFRWQKEHPKLVMFMKKTTYGLRECPKRGGKRNAKRK